MSQSFSYRHLYYFWVVAHEGGIARAAERLGMAVQTVSAQVRELERTLGCALLKPSGRGVALTDAGQRPGVRLAVGVFDGLPKLAVQRLLEPVLSEPHLRLLCHVDEYERLMADLALHRLDVVLADRAAPAHPTIKVYSHRLSESMLAWWAPPGWADEAARGFPQSLARVPVLLPTAHAAVRARIDQWFDKIGVRPMVVGEFEDSALLKTFGAGGMGVFPAAELVSDVLQTRYGVQCIGRSDEVAEHFYAIGTEKKVAHPLVQRLLPTAR